MTELEQAWADCKTYIVNNKEGRIITLPIFVVLTTWAVSDGLSYFAALIAATFIAPVVVLPAAFVGGLIYRFFEITYEFLSRRKNY